MWKKETEQIVIFDDDKDEKIHHLKDVSKETAFWGMLIDAVKKGDLRVYEDNGFTQLLTIQKVTERLDYGTVLEEVEDPVSGDVVKGVRHKNIYNSVLHEFKITKDWVFYPVSGKIDMQISGMAPAFWWEQQEQGKSVLHEVVFWFKYKDVSDLLAKYAEYHPSNSLAIQVWNSYFLDETKPSQEK